LTLRLVSPIVRRMKVALTPHQQKFIAEKMKSGGYLSQSEVMREALRVYELNEQDENDPTLEDALRHSLRSPLKKFRPGHFASLAQQNGRSRK
jgi:putative addiction module CopG family antidote